MKKKRNVIKKDWYEILNENLNYANKEIDIINSKRKEILNEQIKLNEVNLIKTANSVEKTKIRKNPIEMGFSLPGDNKLIASKLNLKNYKTKNLILGNTEILFLKTILEKMNKINEKKINKKKYIINKTETNNFIDNNSIYNRPKYLTSRNNKKEREKIVMSEKKEIKNRILKDNNNLLSKTYNHFNNNINTISFPKLKINNKNDYLNNKKKIMKIILNEEGNSINKGKSISNNIFQLNKNFVKNKRLICGYDNKDEDYIMVNNKKIYQINLEKEMNKKFRQNFLNIKKIQDIENGLFNDNNNIFDNAKKNIILKYQQKIKKI